MQRELISIPKILLYIAFTVFLFVFQTSILGAHPLFGYHLDLLPAAVAAAARPATSARTSSCAR